ncbi:hypothetical protein MYX76_12035, partial [Desulfobacterota bacterium AH_259_B03_O07]|nr:hypothetical protein [Desulfobacterota bacterium AH_259_B03_O07]
MKTGLNFSLVSLAISISFVLALPYSMLAHEDKSNDKEELHEKGDEILAIYVRDYNSKDWING